MKFVIIKDEIVENIIVAESKEIAEEVTGKTCVEYDDANPAHIGLGFNGTVFEQPPIPEPPANLGPAE
jgi:hypothetical protein